MKKTLLILFIMAAALQLSAQQLTLKPTDSAFFKSPKSFPNLKLSDSALFKKYLQTPNLNSLVFANTLKEKVNANAFYSTMPVVKMGSNDKMPVAKLGDGSMNYTMLIKKITVVNPLEKQKPATP